MKKSKPRSEALSAGPYAVTGNDSVHRLLDFPDSSGGAPFPLVLAFRDPLLLAYYAQTPLPAEFTGPGFKTAREVSTESEEPVVVVEFAGPLAHYMGRPNDEAFSGHPLAARGLRSYGAWEVRDSSWIRAHEVMNRVHEYRDPARYASLRHFVIPLKDSTFECIAKSYTCRTLPGPLSKVARKIMEELME